MSRQLVLVRHGPTVADPSRPASSWRLADATFADALRQELGDCDAWFSSPEAKAYETAILITDGVVETDDRLREVQRGGFLDDYQGAVARHFEQLNTAAAEGWELGAAVQQRLASWLDDVRGSSASRTAAITHGLAMTHLNALLNGAPPDPAWWRELRMPDVRVYPI